MIDGKVAGDPPALLSTEEFDSLREVGKGDAQGDIPQVHWERLVALGYALRRLGVLGLTESGKRRLATGNLQTESKEFNDEKTCSLD
ncbi:hypothetical protein [Bradyrhizobium sp.]|uniref:hypothetical protein n=1 Tax=Bradyrhizobium sp. TaxID=376 RepID=UPI00260579E9|nr:hypothetical protein [Bradyrhizobium sp.]